MSTDKEKTIEGITCEVESCEHHAIGNHCTAGSIKVTNYNAVSKEETDCSTYKRKF